MYKIMIDSKSPGVQSDTVFISDAGAMIIWDAYLLNFPGATQTMQRRNERGGIAWLSEIESWKKQGLLPTDFNYKDYVINEK